jgi:putative hydrolase of the HAD superfamily
MSLAAVDFARVRAVTFDVGGTLLAPHPSVGAVYAEALSRHGIELTPEVIEARFSQTFRAQRAAPGRIVGEDGERTFWRAVVRSSLAPECPPEKIEPVFAELWEEFARAHRWRPLPGAGDLLEALAARGTPCAALSNWDARLHRVLAGLGWTRHFRAVLVSSEIGAEKPHARVFRAAERALGAPADGLLHVGDNLAEDYRGARAAGWQAVLVAPAPLEQEPLAARVARLDELRSHLV